VTVSENYLRMKLSYNFTSLLNVLSTTILIILGNFIFGYKFHSIFSLVKSWIILPVAILIVSSCTWQQYTRSILAAIIVILDYILLKTFLFSESSSSPDTNFGLYLANISWIISVIVSAITLSIILKKEAKEKPKNKFNPLIPYFIIVSAFFLYYHSFGADYNKKPSVNITQSKKRDVFVSKFQTSTKSLRIKKEEIHLKEAWLEKQIRFNHKGIFRKVSPTGKYFLLINKNHNIKDWGFSNKYEYYKDGNIKTTKFLFSEGPFMFISDSIQNEITITLKRLDKDSVQFKVINSQ
jgi:hypothetical protein